VNEVGGAAVLGEKGIGFLRLIKKRLCIWLEKTDGQFEKEVPSGGLLEGEKEKEEKAQRLPESTLEKKTNQKTSTVGGG